jgi:hypothetical protein
VKALIAGVATPLSATSVFAPALPTSTADAANATAIVRRTCTFATLSGIAGGDVR